jgi:hypothetical protein
MKLNKLSRGLNKRAQTVIWLIMVMLFIIAEEFTTSLIYFSDHV